MKTTIKLGLWVFCFLLTFSCSSDFLDRNPTNSTTADKAITTLGEAKTAMNGVYRQLIPFAYYGNRFLLYADYKGLDMVVPMGGRANDALYTFNHGPDLDAYSDYWDIMYWALLQINNVLGNIDAGKVEVKPSEQADLNDIKGQALTLRALVHFDLVKLYGYPYMKDNGTSLGVTIATEVFPASAKPDRSTVADAYSRIIADLTEATSSTTPLLKKAKNNGMINYWVAKSLLARVNLYKGDWEVAYTHAKDVIESGVYAHYAPADWVGSWKANFGSESILELHVTVNEGDLGNAAPARHLRPSDVNDGLGTLVASDSYLVLLGEDPTDVRWGVMDLDEYGLGHIAGKPGGIQDRKGWVKKYNGKTGVSSITANNIIVIRFSDILLIGAEAALKKSSPDKINAVDWLNRVRQRAAGLPLAVDTEDTADLIAKIANERRKELICEGHGYFDLMRVGTTINYEPPKNISIPLGGRPDVIDWTYYKCILPISRAERRANPNIQQNPSYEN